MKLRAILKHGIDLWSLLLAIFISPFLLLSQHTDTSYQFIFQKTGIRYFTVDPLQNLYAVSTDGLLTKYNVEGEAMFTYDNTVLGELTSIDATDPFNLLLFFPEQQSLVLLDRTLSERSIMDLRNSAVEQASAVALSYDNNIWVFDDIESQLLQIDANAKILFSSDNLRLTENTAEEVTHIFRWKDKILVNFPKQGIAIFNIFAQLEGWWPITGVLNAQVLPQGFMYHTAEGHFLYLPRPDKIEAFTHERFKNCAMVRFQFFQQYFLDKQGVLTVLDVPEK